VRVGFENPTIVKVPQVWRLPWGNALFEVMKNATVRTAGLLRSQKPVVLDKIREAVRGEAEQYRKGDTVELPMPALIASARKPAK
jgi:hypothetical protein